MLYYVNLSQEHLKWLKETVNGSEAVSCKNVSRWYARFHDCKGSIESHSQSGPSPELKNSIK